MGKHHHDPPPATQQPHEKRRSLPPRHHVPPRQGPVQLRHRLGPPQRARHLLRPLSNRLRRQLLPLQLNRDPARRFNPNRLVIAAPSPRVQITAYIQTPNLRPRKALIPYPRRQWPTPEPHRATLNFQPRSIHTNHQRPVPAQHQQRRPRPQETGPHRHHRHRRSQHHYQQRQALPQTELINTPLEPAHNPTPLSKPNCH